MDVNSGKLYSGEEAERERVRREVEGGGRYLVQVPEGALTREARRRLAGRKVVKVRAPGPLQEWAEAERRKQKAAEKRNAAAKKAARRRMEKATRKARRR